MSSIHRSARFLDRTMGTAVAIAAFLVFTAHAMAAQPDPRPANSSSTPSARKSPRHRTRPAEIQAPAAPEMPGPAQQPELPKWPVNDAPSKPSVTWDSSGLKIQANNSSLHDI